MESKPQVVDDTEQKLLEAACQVFAAKGRSATVREIIARAGLKNIAAINYYFGDKDKLYEAALRHAFHCRLDDAATPSWPEGTPPAVILRDLIRLVVQRLTVDHLPWHMQMLLREMTDPGKAGYGVVRDFIRPIYQLFWQALRALKPDISEEKLHLVAFSIVGQCFYHKVGRNVIRGVVGDEEAAGYTPECLADHIADFSLRALGIDPTSLVKPAREEARP
jgi:TetR/AcrR family transcriptional regulator, regulator of cefoperazone and chloramphenicol sensitivity